MKKAIRITFKVILWVLAGIILLGLALVLLIHVPAVQDYGRKKVVGYLQEKFQTEVAVGRIHLALPNTLRLEGVYLEDRQADTLLSAGNLFVDIRLFRLLNNEVKINEIQVENFYANLRRRADSSFNFDFITEAFETEETPPELQDTTASPLIISLDKITLDDIRLDYRDETLSSAAAVSLTHLSTRIHESDIEKMRFGAKQTRSEGLYLSYQDGSAGLETLLRLGRLGLSAVHLDLLQQEVDLETVQLDSTQAVVAFTADPEKPPAAPSDSLSIPGSAPEASDAGWKVRLGQLQLNHTALRFDDHNAPRQAAGIDYMHLDMDGLALDLREFAYSPDRITGSLREASFRDQSGFLLKTLRTDFLYTGTGAALDQLYLETGGSRLQKRIRIAYPSLEQVSENPGLLSIEADLEDCRLSYADLVLLAPFLAEYEPFKSPAGNHIDLQGTVRGPVSDLVIENLEAATLDQTYLAASAQLKGLPDMEKAWFDVQLEELASGRANLHRLAGPELIPSSIRIPARISMTAGFRGSLNEFTTQARLRSSYGNLDARGRMTSGSGEGLPTYNAEVNLIDFDLGRLLKQEDSLGRVSFTAAVEGSGTTLENADAQLEGVLQKLEYAGYPYVNLQLKGSIRDQQVNAWMGMQDPHLHFDLNAAANLAGRYPAVTMNLRLDTLDLHALNLYEKELRLRMNLTADLPTADPNYLNGQVRVDRLALRLDSGTYHLDTIAFRATASDTLQTMSFDSEFMEAALSGNFTAEGIGPAIQQHINRYFNTRAIDSLESVNVESGNEPPSGAAQSTADSIQQLTLTARIFHPPVIRELLPELSRLDTVCIDAQFDNRNDLLQLNAVAPAIRYGSNEVDSVVLAVNTQDTSIAYHLGIQRIYNPAIQVLNTGIEGELAGDRASIGLITRDRNHKPRYRVEGSIQATDSYVFRFHPGTLLLDYEEWTVQPDNGFFLNDSGFYARNIRFSNRDQFLEINSEEYRPGAPLGIRFNEFELSTLTRIAQQDSLAIGGQLNGTAQISNFDTTLAVVADLLIEDFSFRSDTVGDVAMKMSNEEENAYAAEITVKSARNQAYLAGYYYPEAVEGNNMDLSLDILNLDMATVQAFSFGQISDASGSLKGSFNITGTTDQPSILGGLAFKKVSLTPTYINSPLYFEDELIGLTDEGIAFSRFTILDSMKNSAVLDGVIRTTDFTDYGFDLQFTTSNFRAINSKRGDNELFYGQLYLDSDVKVKGTLDHPEVDAYIRVNEKTDLTLLLPSSDPSVQDREGVVEFVDMDAPPDMLPPDTLRAEAGITGLNLSADLEVDEEARFTIIVDPVNGDNLQIKGNAALSTSMDPNGIINLTGRYEIAEGAYELSFNLIKRRFEISEGSYITWVGDPYSADVDITAVYVAETAPLELVQDQLTSMSQSERNTFKQTLPFQVELHMEGELMKPTLSFRIDLPEKEREAHDGLVYARLQQLQLQESDLNKQVFALLVLNRFVAENPFESAGGTSVSSIARQSVSKLLSEQLNRLAGDLIAGVDLNFDLESTEDYSTGEKVDRTDLNVGLSKNLLNDRITVNVGSSFGLEGQETRGQASTIAGDVSVDYRLSRDGRYLLRAYRQNEYEGVIEGQIIETGLSFIISLDYDKFKELFKK
ncbi:MAG: translocation/assembly module TamB domain-containing protein [Solitalea sp.]